MIRKSVQRFSEMIMRNKKFCGRGSYAAAAA
jgi:hypothetical protein